MKIHQLKVQNFRCFERATFDFSPGFNLFVGVNGSGKSSLLKAVVGSLATPLNGLGKNTVWLHDQEANARLALVEMKGRVRYERCYPVRLEVKGEVNGVNRDWWMEQAGPGNNQNKWEHTIFSALTSTAASVVQGGAGALPVVVFYTAERQWKLVGVGAEAAVRQQDSRLDGYISWENASVDVKGLESWVVAKSLERLEATSDTSTVLSGMPLDELDLVNTAVKEAVPGAKGLRYDIKYRRLVLDWIAAEPMPFDTLSDGQRGLVALVADIARRMCLLNPQLGDAVLAETPGIVVIDELDMHLHPAWQRRLPGFLKKTFPKVQFIAASHSPQVLGELQTEEINLLRPTGTAHPQVSYGLTSSQVLEEIMGADARSPEVQSLVTDVFGALERGELQAAREKLTKLEEVACGIPELAGANALLRRKEVLGR